jgi:acyl-CoA thioester hydrolase
MTAARFRRSFRVRYGEVDQQGVVYNAHYMVYIDETMEAWIATFGDIRKEHGWDMMLKKCTLEWQGSAGHGDRIDVDVAVTRWGRSSWSLGYVGSRNGAPVFTAEVVYVSVGLGGKVPVPTPAAIREHLGPAVDLLGAGES